MIVRSTHAEFACHSKACAPPPAGRGGSDKSGSGRRVTVDRASASKFIDTGHARNFTASHKAKNPERGHRNPHWLGITGHTKATIDRVLGVEKYSKSPGHGRVWKVKGDSPEARAYNKALAAVRGGMTREQARAKGAFR